MAPSFFNRRGDWLSLGANLFSILLLFLLFWEWLRPLLTLTPTERLFPFLFLFMLVLVLKWWRLPTLPVVSGVILFFIHRLYFEGPLFSPDWLVALCIQLLADLPPLITLNWNSFSLVSRTFFFFLLVWLIALSLFHSLMIRKKILYFVVLTIVYLGVLDSFTPYEAEQAVIRSLLAGFLLLSLVNWNRLSQGVEGRSRRALPFIGWLSLSLCLVLTSAALAYTAPKAEPAWPDPIPLGESGAQRSGYGSLDHQLGGPFTPDDSILFRAVTNSDAYWRGEMRDVYTGQGWESSDRSEVYFSFDQLNQVKDEQGLSLFTGQTERKQIEGEVKLERGQPQLFLQGDPIEIRVDPEQVLAGWELSSGRLLSYDGQSRYETVALSGYRFISEVPSFSVARLREASLDQVPAEIAKRYTQLPESLPERVRQLAFTLVEGKESMYDQVRAIENYFRLNGYQYETKDVPVPGPDQDYVDQFLFETRRGYCDNFSTAMVVMLRTLEIPARWVKGFSPGEMVEQVGEKSVRVIRNSHAHSWVEVYFPGTGWVPFEPTPTFQNPFHFEQDQTEVGKDREEPADQDEGRSVQERGEQLGDSPLPMFSPEWKRWGVALFALLAAAGVGLILLWLHRSERFFSWFVWRAQEKEGLTQPDVRRSYARLVQYLEQRMGPKHPSQTWREYLLQLEQDTDLTRLAPLIRRFESIRYGSQSLSKRELEQLYTDCLALWQRVRAAKGKKNG